MATKKKTQKKETAITKQETTDLARPSFIEKGLGEKLDTDDLLVPRIDVAQALSPQIDESDPAFIPGLKQGQLFNTASGQVYGASIDFVSVAYKKEFLIFKDRKKGGGFFGSHPTEAEAARAIADLNEDGLEAFKSLSNLVMLLDGKGDYTGEMVYLSCTRTKVKVAKKMNTHLQMVNAPRYASKFQLSTVKEQNNKGQSYYNFQIRPIGWVEDRDLYEQAKALAEAVKGQNIQGDYGKDDDTAAEY